MLHPRKNPLTTVIKNPRNGTLVVRGRKNLSRKILDRIECRGSIAAELIDGAKVNGNQKWRSFEVIVTPQRN